MAPVRSVAACGDEGIRSARHHHQSMLDICTLVRYFRVIMTTSILTETLATLILDAVPPRVVIFTKDIFLTAQGCRIQVEGFNGKVAETNEVVFSRYSSLSMTFYRPNLHTCLKYASQLTQSPPTPSCKSDSDMMVQQATRHVIYPH